MSRRTPVAVAAAVACVTSTAAPAAASVLRVGGHTAAMAGDAVVTARIARDATVIVRRNVGASLARLPPPTRDTNQAVVTLAGSAAIWAVAVKWLEIEPGEGGGTFERGEAVVAGRISGGRPVTLMRCTNPGETDEPLGLAVAGDDVAWSEAACPGGDGIRLAPADGGPARRVGDGTGVELTVSHLAYQGAGSQRGRIVVVDRRTDATSFVTAPGASGFALDDRGVAAVVVQDDGRCTGGCGESLRQVASDGTVGPALAPALADPLVAGGGRVLAQRPRGNGVVAVDLATAGVSYAGALGHGPDETIPLAVDAGRATYSARACDGVLTVRAERTSPGRIDRLRTIPCPVRVLTRSAVVDARRRRALIRVRCPRGCSTSLEAIHRRTDIGSATFRLPAGATRTVPLRFASLRALRRRRVATVLLHEDNPRPRAASPAAVRLRLRIR